MPGETTREWAKNVSGPPSPGRRGREGMSAQFRLREDAEELERSGERLTRDIEEAEKRIVELRRKRDEVRFHRAEMMAAANALDSIGFKAWRDDNGIVNVAVDPKP